MEIPPPYDEFLIGRIVEHPEEEGLMGFVKYAPSIRIGEHDAEVEAEEGIQISYKFLVKWDDGTEEDMEDDDVQKIATQEFIKEEWVSERILALQEVSVLLTRLILDCATLLPLLLNFNFGASKKHYSLKLYIYPLS